MVGDLTHPDAVRAALVNVDAVLLWPLLDATSAHRLAEELAQAAPTETSAVLVDRLPGRAAYPRQSGPARLFELLPGQIGRYRANFRFTVTTCACDPSWFYEDWLILIAHGEVPSDGFIVRTPDHDVDHRVHLYGGASRPHQR